MLHLLNKKNHESTISFVCVLIVDFRLVAEKGLFDARSEASNCALCQHIALQIWPSRVHEA